MGEGWAVAPLKVRRVLGIGLECLEKVHIIKLWNKKLRKFVWNQTMGEGEAANCITS
jgi:hypothetical protein